MPKLVVLEGPNRGAVLSLAAGETRIGRDAAAGLRLPDPRISRRHASIAVTDGGATLADLGSRNATYLNGVRVVSPRPLGHGDEVRFGDTIVLYLADEPPSDPCDESGGRSDTDALTLSKEQARFFERAAAAGPTVAREHYLVGDSAALRRVSDLVARCAPLETTVLITGESGTGKELVAQALHRLSPRREAPLLVVNCATLEPALLESELFGHERGSFTGAIAKKLGKLELARGGTVLLDEIGELPGEAQAKLLRAIDQREFQRVGGHEVLKTDARFIAATHRDLQALVREGEFREDLLFRLRVIEVTIPPLRERREDVAPLVEHFLGDLGSRIPSRARRFSPEALLTLAGYRFPGNVRELRNVLERCLILCPNEEIGVEDLPPEVRGAAPAEAGTETPEPAEPHTIGPVVSLAVAERAQIRRALETTGGNKSQAAKILGIDRNTLAAKMKRLGIEKA